MDLSRFGKHGEISGDVCVVDTAETIPTEQVREPPSFSYDLVYKKKTNNIFPRGSQRRAGGKETSASSAVQWTREDARWAHGFEWRQRLYA